MKEEIVISVKNISKIFRLRQSKTDDNGKIIDEHWALKDISFEIKRGESIGIIGPNGSGKSTLLKILAGVTKPTSGSVTIRGKVASILDIGAGFHPELSGRENVFLNGQIHGFSKKEIASKFDEIVDFSGIGEFIEEPVKNYSNGMYLRLAFSIMVHLDFDVYLFDEVMSVGDAEFNFKSQEKINELFKFKKTILLVSHALSSLYGKNQYIHLVSGSIKEISKDSNFLSDYIEKTIKRKNITVYDKNLILQNFPKESAHIESKNLKLIEVSMIQEEGLVFSSEKQFFLTITYEKIDDYNTYDIVLNINNFDGNVLLTATPFLSNGFSTNIEKGKQVITCEIPANLFNSQIYSIDITFIKNLQNHKHLFFNEKTIDNEFLEKNNLDIEVLYKDLIWFKPSFYFEGALFDLGKINTRNGLLVPVKWTITNF